MGFSLEGERWVHVKVDEAKGEVNDEERTFKMTPRKKFYFEGFYKFIFLICPVI